MGTVRFIYETSLCVKHGSSQDTVYVKFGDLYKARKLVDCRDGYFNIHLEDGSVFDGVLGEIFENMCGKVPVEYIQVNDIKEDVPVEVDDEVIDGLESPDVDEDTQDDSYVNENTQDNSYIDDNEYESDNVNPDLLDESGVNSGSLDDSDVNSDSLDDNDADEVYMDGVDVSE